MSAWKNFYAGREGHDYRMYVQKRYAPFIEAIASRINYLDLVLELGTGTGTITSLLADYHCDDTSKFAATDIDDEMVQIAKERMDDLNLADVQVYREDALSHLFPTRAEVVHSHGMLEHFDDHTIRKIIDNYRHARVQVHYVPGLYGEPTFGDERLLPVQAWWDICKPDQIITFNEGLDYALIFEKR
jgi:trans-aconitate methyltransferase